MRPGPAPAGPVTDASSTVRVARRNEYPSLALLVARRLAPTGSQAPLALAVRRAYLVGCAVLAFAAFGALTVGRREAVGSAWAVDEESRGAVRAAPLIAVLAALELALIAVSPAWVPLVLAVVLTAGLVMILRSHRARAEVRARPRPGALFVANLASRRSGAGRQILDTFVAQAAAEGRYLCLEAPAAPGLIAFYRKAGLEVVGPSVRDGRREVVYMERSPLA